jgi:DNA-binding transcriptional MerR regulator
VRHWTRERLLFPSGETNPGIGKHRVYDDAALHDALILDAMTSTGVPIAVQRNMISKIGEQRQQWRIGQRKKGEPDLLLVIETYPWGAQPYFVEGAYTTNEYMKHVIIFNLTKLFSRKREA